VRGQFLEAVVDLAVLVEQAVFLAEEEANEVHLVLHFERERVDELQDVNSVEYDSRALLKNKLPVRPPRFLRVAVREGNLEQLVVYGLEDLPYALIDANVRKDVILLGHGGDQVLYGTKEKFEEALGLVGHGVRSQRFNHAVLNEVFEVFTHGAVCCHLRRHEAVPLIFKPQHLHLVLFFQGSNNAQNVLADLRHVCNLLVVLGQLLADVKNLRGHLLFIGIVLGCA